MGLFGQFHDEVRRILLPRTRLRASLPCSKRRDFKKEAEHLFLQLESLFVLYLCGVATLQK